MKLSILNGHVVDPKNGIDQKLNVHIQNGRIVAVGRAPNGFGKAQSYDASGLVVCPGIIDLVARLREPGEEHKATIASETRAAVSGGITSLVCPPDTNPIIDTPAMARMIQDRAAENGLAKVFPLGALTMKLEGQALTDMAMLTDAGCVGVSNALQPINNTLVMRRAMQYASNYDIPVIITPQDSWLLGNGCVHEGEVSTRLGLPAIPEAAETVGVARDLALIETSGARAHFDLISCGRSVEMIAEAQKRGLPITSSVAAHHLHLNENDIAAFDTRYKVMPPLRTLRDQKTLRKGLSKGIISVICSDHQPHGKDAKLAPFSEAASGISGLESLLPLTLDLVHEGHLTMNSAIAALTCNPAAITGIDAGNLSVGSVADICIFDFNAQWTFDQSTILSQGKNSPFVHNQFKGQVMATLIDGRIVYQHN